MAMHLLIRAVEHETVMLLDDANAIKFQNLFNYGSLVVILNCKVKSTKYRRRL